MSNLQPRNTFSSPRWISHWLLALAAAVLLTACSSTGDGTGNSGRYAMNSDAPPDGDVELDPDNIPDAVPVEEPRTAAGNKSPYTVLGETYEVMPESTDFEQTGKASWYGKKFHGYKTSNGEIYSMYKMSAAHRTLPIPSYVRVTNLDNGKSGIVRVNDRGPFHSNRIIDVSYAAAVKLDMVRSGTARVKIEAITPATAAYAARDADRDALSEASHKSSGRSKTPAAASSTAKTVAKATTASSNGSAWLQAGAFRSEGSAQALSERIAALTGQPVRVESAQGLHKVRIGPLADPAKINEISELLVANDIGKPQVIYF